MSQLALNYNEKLELLQRKISEMKRQIETHQNSSSTAQMKYSSTYQHKNYSVYKPPRHIYSNRFPSHKNKTLILNNGSSPTAFSSLATPTSSLVTPATSSLLNLSQDREPQSTALLQNNENKNFTNNFVQSYSQGGLKLINKEIFDKNLNFTLNRKKIIREQKNLIKVSKIVSKNNVKFDYCDRINLNGISYAITLRGFKLIPLSTFDLDSLPSQLKWFSSSYKLSKNGSYIKTDGKLTQIPYCRYYTKTGICNDGTTCKYKHDPNHIALCRKFISGKCNPDYNQCSLSHFPNQFNSPTCVFYLKGFCSKGENCSFNHVKTDKNAKICRLFTLGGWCDRGLSCKFKHIYECPDFINEGLNPCPRGKNCKLSHVIKNENNDKINNNTQNIQKKDELIEQLFLYNSYFNENLKNNRKKNFNVDMNKVSEMIDNSDSESDLESENDSESDSENENNSNSDSEDYFDLENRNEENLASGTNEKIKEDKNEDENNSKKDKEILKKIQENDTIQQRNIIMISDSEDSEDSEDSSISDDLKDLDFKNDNNGAEFSENKDIVYL
ncbi:cleavage polyadenylation factor RNA-binding subunit YTH1 ASCRUDRAFT_84246 [Ascoidea rubescens DSM 1968]|uniref:C3H1-type domain-containing protein n=1 Tax=Ascoidea rubescens DSM 1968 TaxID=1344418 RepID=A0A1D2VS60_9ASCO|nr:hypothetical protein ASCRUDRAFT_84246 [Ascoidea rubescens DSM 1968]ODV64443.1 hypothetical protein ASCRUDRAFT_84246 [Ascoidea rubescens DSM 1968]